MSLEFPTILICFALVGIAAGEAPKQVSSTHYEGLWNRSPFTNPARVTDPAGIVNPFSDYTLLGVSPVPSGYRVTMIRKAAPAERIVVETGNSKGGFRILDVKLNTGEPLGTTVALQMGNQHGEVGYDEKFLAITPRVSGKKDTESSTGKADTGTPPPPAPSLPPHSRVVAPPDKTPTKIQTGRAVRH